MNNKKILTLITGLCADLSEIPGIEINLIYPSKKKYIYLTITYPAESGESGESGEYNYDVLFDGPIHMEGNEFYSPQKLLEAANKLNMLAGQYEKK